MDPLVLFPCQVVGSSAWVWGREKGRGKSWGGRRGTSSCFKCHWQHFLQEVTLYSPVLLWKSRPLNWEYPSPASAAFRRTYVTVQDNCTCSSVVQQGHSPSGFRLLWLSLLGCRPILWSLSLLTRVSPGWTVPCLYRYVTILWKVAIFLEFNLPTLHTPTSYIVWTLILYMFRCGMMWSCPMVL